MVIKLLKSVASYWLGRDQVRVDSPSVAQHKKLYNFLNVVVEKDFLHQCSVLKFTESEIRALLDLRDAALRGYQALDRSLVQASPIARGSWPFELLSDANVQRQQAESIGRMRDFVRDRRVVITGPSAHIIGTGKGTEIDDHDVVVRINFQWPLREELQKDFGNRIDILYHCCNGDFAPDDLVRSASGLLSFACLEMNPYSLRMKHALTANGTQVAYLDEAREGCKGLLAAPPSTGITAITHLLSLPLKSLSVIGITSWASNYYKGYKGDGASEHAGSGFPANIWQHNPRAEARLLLNLVESEKRLSIDSEALAIMARALLL